MASAYPNALDNFVTNHVLGEVISHTTDNDQADALNKIEAELGIQPSGSFATVKSRFDALDTILGASPQGTYASIKARLDANDTELGVDPSGTYANVKTRLDTTDSIRNQITKGWVNHGSTAGTARPTNHATYEWYGSVTPTNAANGDTYINTSTGIHYVKVAGSFIAQPQGSGGSSSGLRVASLASNNAVLTLDMAGDKNVLFIVTCTSNFLANVINLTAGARFIVETRENGTGGHALQYPGFVLSQPDNTKVIWQSGVEFTPNNAPNAISFMEYYSPDGTNIRGLTGVATGGGGGGAAQSYQDLGSISGARTLDMNGETNKLFVCRCTAATTFTFTNFALGAWAEIRAQQPTSTTAAITWPTGLWSQGSAPVTTLAANAVDRVAYNKSTSGTPDGFIVGNNFRTALP